MPTRQRCEGDVFSIADEGTATDQFAGGRMPSEDAVEGSSKSANASGPTTRATTSPPEIAQSEQARTNRATGDMQRPSQRPRSAVGAR